jgi:hypothetical protein
MKNILRTSVVACYNTSQPRIKHGRTSPNPDPSHEVERILHQRPGTDHRILIQCDGSRNHIQQNTERLCRNLRDDSFLYGNT